MAAVVEKPCSKCGNEPRLSGANMTWGRECKNEWQRSSRRRRGVRPKARPLRERLYERTAILPDGCVLWTGYLNENGYGQVGRGPHGGGLILAHVASWQLTYGPVPDGLELDHLCCVRACIAPAHLEPVTHAENMRRAREHQLAARDGLCPNGHVYDSVRPNGNRRCLTCARDENRRSRARRLVEV